MDLKLSYKVHNAIVGNTFVKFVEDATKGTILFRSADSKFPPKQTEKVRFIDGKPRWADLADYSGSTYEFATLEEAILFVEATIV